MDGSGWVDAQKDDLISNGHYEKEIVWALCKDCGTPFFYETGEKRAIKPSDDEGYAVNTAGQTYGSALFARSREEHPDLISAVGNHGTVGYIYASDLDAGEPITLSEALAQQAKIEELIEECAGEEVFTSMKANSLDFPSRFLALARTKSLLRKPMPA